MIREVVEVRRGIGAVIDGDPRSMLARGGGDDDKPLVGISFGSTLGDSIWRDVGSAWSLDTEDDVSMRACSPSTVAAMTA